jgi:hypothetical protein
VSDALAGKRDGMQGIRIRSPAIRFADRLGPRGAYGAQIA